MNRATFIEKLTEVQRNVQQLLTQLQASEHDKFVAHLYQARKHYRTDLRATKQGQQGHRARSHLKLPGRAELGIQTVTFARGSTCCEFTNDDAGWRKSKARRGLNRVLLPDRDQGS